MQRPSPTQGPLAQLVRAALTGAALLALSGCAASVSTGGGDGGSEAGPPSDVAGDSIVRDTCAPVRMTSTVEILPEHCLRTSSVPIPSDAGAVSDSRPADGSSGFVPPPPDAGPEAGADTGSSEDRAFDVQPRDATGEPPSDAAPRADVQPRDVQPQDVQPADTSTPPIDVDPQTCVLDCARACAPYARPGVSLTCQRVSTTTVQCVTTQPCGGATGP